MTAKETAEWIYLVVIENNPYKADEAINKIEQKIIEYAKSSQPSKNNDLLGIGEVSDTVCGDTTFECNFRKKDKCYNIDECSLKI